MVYGSIFSDEYNDSIYLMDSVNSLDSVLIMNVKRGDDWSFMEKKIIKKKQIIFLLFVQIKFPFNICF